MGGESARRRRVPPRKGAWQPGRLRYGEMRNVYARRFTRGGLRAAFTRGGYVKRLREAVYARRGQAKRTFCAASSQMAFFWFLKARVAMWPLMAACWPMGGGAMGCSLPCTLRMKLRK